MSPKTISVILCLFFCGIIASAQTKFQQILSSDKGLSSTLIGDILQDRNGNLWIATENGLNRYDGVKLTNYFHDNNDPHSLNSNYVRTLFEDRDGNLFIGTRAGIQIYDPASDSFSLTSTFINGEPSYNIVNHIIQRKNGDIIASGNILSKVSIIDGTPKIEQIEAGEFSFVAEEVFEDSHQRLWITKEGKGIMRIDPDNSIHHYTGKDDTKPFILCINEDAKGNILAGSSINGIFCFDEGKDEFFPLSDEKCIARKIFVHNDQETLICTDGKGLKVYNNLTGRVSDYHFETDIVEPQKAKVHCITKDKQENLWMALYQQGVLMIPAHKNPFQLIGTNSYSADIIGSCCVMTVKIGTGGETFIGTDNDGLYIVSADKTTAKHLSHDDNPDIPPIVIGLHEDSQHNLWIGSYGSGATILNLKTLKTKKVRGLFENGSRKEPANNIYDFAEDNEQRVWIATMGGGLHCYDMKSKGMTTCDELNKSIGNWISNIEYSKSTNSLLIGTYDGLWKIGLNNLGNDNHLILSKSIIHDICEDSDGVIWAATSDGLARWHTRDAGQGSQEIEMFTPEEGFPSNICYSIEEDDNNMLWIGTGNGLVRMNRKTLALTSFYIEDGIQGNEFSKNASTYNPLSKELYFGGVNGVTWFNPNEVLENSQKWEVHITNMYVAGNPVFAGRKSGNRDIITKPIYEADDFYLSHSDNAFTIEIGSNDLSGFGRKEFFYRMDSDPWIALPKGTNQVSFSSLPPGTYTFRTKIVDGGIESDVRTIYIHIRPAWWMSWWAVLIVLCTLAYIIYNILEQIRHRHIMRIKMLHHIQSERHSESKLQFLTNVSHKIRTPMTLILNPLQELMETDSDKSRQEKYKVMIRNAERIMTLVNQFMDVRKSEEGRRRAEEVLKNFAHVEEANTDDNANFATNSDSLNMPTILIAEDDDDIRHYLKTELSDQYRIITMGNGAEALDFIMKEVPNLIISDVMMPEMDGFTLVKKIRQNIQFNDVPIILLTARSLNEDYIRGLELGADAYITKPFDIRILRQNIASLLKSRQTLKNIYSGNQAQEGKIDEIKTKTPDEILIEKVMKVINENIGNSELSVEMIAEEVGVSRVHLHRKLKQLTNQSTRDLIRNQRITLAAKILKEKKMPISEVAYHVGFSSPAHFTTSFKAMYGISPTQYCLKENS